MTEMELQELVEALSIKWFNKPFRHRARFNSRLRTTGGRYLLRSHDIEVNEKHFRQYGLDELVGIIKHELCHYHLHLEGKGYQHRDEDFRRLLKEVGAPRHCQSVRPLTTKKQPIKQHVYACSKCNTPYLRRRQINTKKYVCGKCGGTLNKVKTLLLE